MLKFAIDEQKCNKCGFCANDWDAIKEIGWKLCRRIIEGRG